MKKALNPRNIVKMFNIRKTQLHIFCCLGAILIGLISVLLSKSVGYFFAVFSEITVQHPWWPFISLPLGGVFLIWFMKKVAPGTEGSGIQQAIAALQVANNPKQVAWLVNIKIATAKFFALIIGIGCGFVIGLEGPTVQIGACIMFAFHRYLPFDNAIIRRQLVMMGGSSGIAAAFNAPMAGIMFALEEMWRSVESHTVSRIALAIILAGVTAFILSGKETYFGSIDAAMHFDLSLIPVIVVVTIIGGFVGGLFSWLVVKSTSWMPKHVQRLRAHHPYYFIIICSLLLACCGLVVPIFGSGVELTYQLIHGENSVPWYYMPFKFVSMLLTALTGVPGGIFSPSLSLGAGVANCFTTFVDAKWHSELFVIGMVSVLTGVTRAPLTAVFIIIEMTNGHAMIFEALATAFLAKFVARFFHVSFYHDLANRALKNMPADLKQSAEK